jgi:hypothetical protein
MDPEFPGTPDYEDETGDAWHKTCVIDCPIA